MLKRPRRLRYNSILRDMVQENHLGVQDLIMPIFVSQTAVSKEEITSMPGIYRHNLESLVAECISIKELGIPAVLLFGIPAEKDTNGALACSSIAIVPQAIRLIKEKIPGLFVIADLCNCEYTSHGHCGLIVNNDVDNDSTIDILAKQALVLAQAGVDMIAPSDMMDGRVLKIRNTLDESGYTYLPIMAYSVKYSSAFYGPFRDAAGSAPQFGDRRTYQMNPANVLEGLKEASLDEEEGADILMVKPALSYMDVIYRVKNQTCLPVAAYNVSGEYSMVKAAAKNGWIDEKRTIMEIMLSLKRAGADLIITYHAKEVACWLKGE